VATWQGMTWQRELFGPGLDAYDPYASVRSDRPAPPQAPAGLPPLAPLPTAAQPIVQRVQPPAPSRSDQATRLAQDIAYGHSDWERAGQAVLGSGKFEDASGLRRAGAFVGGAALGTLALASWIPGFNVFKPAQAARAARAFGQGAARGADTGTITGALRTGYRDAAELERQRRAAVAARKAADRPVAQSGLAAERVRVYDVTNFRNQTTTGNFSDVERLAVRTNLQQKTIDAVRVGRQNFDPSHPLRDGQRLVREVSEALRLRAEPDSITGTLFIPRNSERFIYTLGDQNPQITRFSRINPADPPKFFMVPEITSDFIDFHNSFSSFFYTTRHLDATNPNRLVEGLLRRQGNAILSEGDSVSVVSVFNNIDEAFSAAAARGRPYIQTAYDAIPVPDSYWPDRTVGQNILARYGRRDLSWITDKTVIPRRARQQASGAPTWQQRTGPVDLVPRGSNADLLERIIQEQGFDRLPTLVNFDDIARLQSEGHLILYRGITSVDNPAQNIRGLLHGAPPADNSRALQWANELFKGKFYAGTGSHGAGLYFTPHVERATSYTEGYGAIVTAALPPNARIMGPGEYEQIGLMLRSIMQGQTAYGEVAGAGILKGFNGTPMQLDMGRLIAMLGYDGYIPYDTVFGYARPEVVMFNRSILTFDRFPQQSWGGLQGLS
jgi:hypothetical protein